MGNIVHAGCIRGARYDRNFIRSGRGTFLRYFGVASFAWLANLILLRKPRDFSECVSVRFYSIHENVSKKNEKLSKEMTRFALVRIHKNQ